ncbi:glycosyltransferase family 2 protein [Flavobacterium reichenbachii]|uniref:Glycosyltransferase 2-like domain-containing protein n=1 Tax=Flavobacterium reichenbachii TaxID=362418 RepID=A0A085ZN70_9FLAO|nr:glycosyltransferase family 2 protein [Flavobacterium reichenbachii]KFF05884.1 hypothetical protein IW19_10265 [Flavobacterium reichenbachii]OXB12766.1 hypothetical protein B0A68_18445 [Flavobacterium reichenbachii]
MITTKLTIVTFCYNDEISIKKQIENIAFADEIILIDDNSSDKTAVIAKELGAVVLQQTENNKTQQINAAIEMAQNNWILTLDPNESISTELKQEILNKISCADSQEFYFAEQTLFFFGKTIKYGAFYNKKRLFLFNKSKISNEEIKIIPAKIFFKRSKTLKNKINLYAYKNFDDYNSSLNSKRKEEALVLFHNNIKPNFYHFFIKPFSSFVRQYFLKFGLIDGREGFILAYINSFSILKRYLILWLLYRKME